MSPFICNEEAMFNTMRSEMEHVLQFTDGYFNLAWHAEKLGRSNGCTQLAWWAKGMAARPAPAGILWTAEALLFLVSKLCSPVCGGRLPAAVLCCCCPRWNAPCWAGSAWKVLPWDQGGACERLFSSVLCCAVLSRSHRNQILLPTEGRWWVCHLPSHFRFLDIL